MNEGQKTLGFRFVSSFKVASEKYLSTVLNQVSAYNKLTNYKPETEELKDTDQEGKENYKLTLGFIKSLTGKLSKSNIVICNDEEKENIKNQIVQLSNAINDFLNKYNLR
jgi:dimeric dUTPase (all-alpha-NTP-PPase superfamily)